MKIKQKMENNFINFNKKYNKNIFPQLFGATNDQDFANEMAKSDPFELEKMKIRVRMHLQQQHLENSR